MAWLVKCLTCDHEDLCLVPVSMEEARHSDVHLKSQAGMTEPGRLMLITGQPALLNFWVSGSVRDPAQKLSWTAILEDICHAQVNVCTHA